MHGPVIVYRLNTLQLLGRRRYGQIGNGSFINTEGPAILQRQIAGLLQLQHNINGMIPGCQILLWRIGEGQSAHIPLGLHFFLVDSHFIASELGGHITCEKFKYDGGLQ
ncbi:hypothetical protein D3C75_715470 [compost metagenome]